MVVVVDITTIGGGAPKPFGAAIVTELAWLEAPDGRKPRSINAKGSDNTNSS